MILSRDTQAGLATAAIQTGWLIELTIDAASDLRQHVSDLIEKIPAWSRDEAHTWLDGLRRGAVPHAVSISYTGDLARIIYSATPVEVGGTLWLTLRETIPGHGRQIRLRYRDRAACVAADRALVSARQRGTGLHTIRGDDGECLLRLGVKKIFASGIDLPPVLPAGPRPLAAPPRRLHDHRAIAAGT